jgi:hypothetical protein
VDDEEAEADLTALGIFAIALKEEKSVSQVKFNLHKPK